MAIITIVGAGMMGSAMAFPASDKGNEVHIVGTEHSHATIDALKAGQEHPGLKRKLPQCVQVHSFEEGKPFIRQADLVINGVSSPGLPWFEQSVLPLVSDGKPVLFLAKGLEDHDGTLIPYPVMCTRRLEPKRRISFLGATGPCISAELADRHDTLTCYCGPKREVLEYVKSLLDAPYYHISLSDDMVGMEFAAALKNAYGLGVSLAQGRAHARRDNEGHNSAAALFLQSCREARRIIRLYGGGSEAFDCFAGDLYVTVFAGRTRLLGSLLGQGIPYRKAKETLKGVTLESVVAATTVAKALRERGDIDPSEFPLLRLIDDMIRHDAKARIPWNAFDEKHFRFD